MERKWHKQCAVPGCSLYAKAVKSGVAFHSFPRDDVLRREWLVKIRNANLGVTLSRDALKNYRVCGKHFRPEDYEDDPKHRYAPHLYKPANILVSGAIPSIFPFAESRPPQPDRGGFAKRETERLRATQMVQQPTDSESKNEGVSKEESCLSANIMNIENKSTSETKKTSLSSRKTSKRHHSDEFSPVALSDGKTHVSKRKHSEPSMLALTDSKNAAHQSSSQNLSDNMCMAKSYQNVTVKIEKDAMCKEFATSHTNVIHASPNQEVKCECITSVAPLPDAVNFQLDNGMDRIACKVESSKDTQAHHGAAENTSVTVVTVHQENQSARQEKNQQETAENTPDATNVTFPSRSCCVLDADSVSSCTESASRSNGAPKKEVTYFENQQFKNISSENGAYSPSDCPVAGILQTTDYKPAKLNSIRILAGNQEISDLGGIKAQADDIAQTIKGDGKRYPPYKFKTTVTVSKAHVKNYSDGTQTPRLENSRICHIPSVEVDQEDADHKMTSLVDFVVQPTDNHVSPVALLKSNFKASVKREICGNSTAKRSTEARIIEKTEFPPSLNSREATRDKMILGEFNSNLACDPNSYSKTIASKDSDVENRDTYKETLFSTNAKGSTSATSIDESKVTLADREKPEMSDLQGKCFNFPNAQLKEEIPKKMVEKTGKTTEKFVYIPPSLLEKSAHVQMDTKEGFKSPLVNKQVLLCYIFPRTVPHCGVKHVKTAALPLDVDQRKKELPQETSTPSQIGSNADHTRLLTAIHKNEELEKLKKQQIQKATLSEIITSQRRNAALLETTDDEYEETLNSEVKENDSELETAESDSSQYSEDDWMSSEEEEEDEEIKKTSDDEWLPSGDDRSNRRRKKKRITKLLIDLETSEEQRALDNKNDPDYENDEEELSGDSEVDSEEYDSGSGLETDVADLVHKDVEDRRRYACKTCCLEHNETICPLAKICHVVENAELDCALAEDSRSRIKETLPSCLYFEEGTDQKVGIFAKERIAASTRFGPMAGELIKYKDIKEDSDMEHLWIFDDNYHGETECLSTEDESKVNWLRYIRWDHIGLEYNLLEYIHEKKVFVVTTKDIEPGTELHLKATEKLICTMKRKVPLALTANSGSFCNVCKIDFKRNVFFRRHLYLVHYGTQSRCRYFCALCSETCLGVRNMRVHARLEHDGLGIRPCNRCKRVFTSEASYRMHEKNHHTVEKIKYPCTECSRKFAHKESLDSHLKSHNHTWVCELCGKTFKTKHRLTVHVGRYHGENGGRNSACDKCGKMFKDIANLKIHMLTHSGVKPFQCVKRGCKAAYTTKQCLQIHYRKAHKCDDRNMPPITRNIPFTVEACTGEDKG